MECKVRYFLTYYKQLALKHILIIFIICSRECHENTPRFLSCLPTGKRLRAQTKEVVANVYEYFEELGRRKRTEGSLKRTSDATKLSRATSRGYGRRNSAQEELPFQLQRRDTNSPDAC